MVKAAVEVSWDDLFADSGAPGIVGPEKDQDGEGWVVYIPGETPCICDSFKSASEMMVEHLQRRARVYGRKAK